MTSITCFNVFYTRFTSRLILFQKVCQADFSFFATFDIAKEIVRFSYSLPVILPVIADILILANCLFCKTLNIIERYTPLVDFFYLSLASNTLLNL